MKSKLRSFTELTVHLTTRTCDSHAALFKAPKSLIRDFFNTLKPLVRFLAYCRIKPQIPRIAVLSRQFL